MHSSSSLFVTKYATFDQKKVKKYPLLLKFFTKKKKIDGLKDLLQDQSQWQIHKTIDQQEQIPREQILQSMVNNFCTSINLKYFWNDETHLLKHIQFSQLKELIFSVDSDCGYMVSIQFLIFLNAPNLVKLDISNMEYGGYNLAPLKKCYFPKLQILDLSTQINSFRNYQQISYAYFPICCQITLFNEYGIAENTFNNRWRAKMQSPSITKQYAELLFPFKKLGSLKKRRKLK